jgi:hypothetical protein
MDMRRLARKALKQRETSMQSETTIVTDTEVDPAAWIDRRLVELRSELATGEAQMLELDQRRGSLRETMLRISGAIQVLTEMAEATRSTAPIGATNGIHDG